MPALGLDPVTACLLFAVAAGAGFIDSIAGGGGLLTVPALLWAGLSPAQALATNKLQSSFGSGAASWQFMRTGKVDPRDFPLAIATCFLGSVLGGLALTRLDPAWLKALIPLMLLGAALFFLFGRIPDQPRPARLSPLAYALLLPSAIGFYDGFFGPGTGSFLVLSLVALTGLGLSEATARTKILNFASNIGSLGLFLTNGQILWGAGLIMAAGQALGAFLGARLVVKQGARIIRPFLVTVSLILTAKLLLDSPLFMPTP